VTPGYGPGKVALMFAVSLLMIPYGPMGGEITQSFQLECAFIELPVITRLIT
jgi:hypothetical protein